jgi:Ribbon-helix-helix protein, copG family
MIARTKDSEVLIALVPSKTKKKIAEMADERGESISLIVREILKQAFDKAA